MICELERAVVIPNAQLQTKYKKVKHYNNLSMLEKYIDTENTGSNIIYIKNLPLTMLGMFELAMMGYVRILGTNEYCILHNTEQGWKALLHRESGNPVSQRWKDIDERILYLPDFTHYLVQRAEDDRWGIFHKDNPEKLVSGWWRRDRAEYEYVDFLEKDKRLK